MDNKSGQLTGYCPLFNHDHAFAVYPDVMSQTTEKPILLRKAAMQAQKELHLDLDVLDEMKKPALLSEKQWNQVLKRIEPPLPLQSQFGFHKFQAFLFRSIGRKTRNNLLHCFCAPIYFQFFL